MTNRGRASLVAVAALILGGGACLFVPSGPERSHCIVTSIIVSASPAVAWNALKSFETMTGDLPAALALGLPVPVQCTLDGEATAAAAFVTSIQDRSSRALPVGSRPTDWS